MKILIADDESEIRTVLRLLLENKGHSVVEVTDGRSAVETAQRTPFDLCIMDIMMPRLSGIEATTEIRAFSDVPILFLTARSLESDKEMAYAGGGDDYLIKPFSSRELLLKVDALTRRYTAYANKSANTPGVIRLAQDVTLTPEERRVEKRGMIIDVRDKEYEVFRYLAEHRGRAISTTELYEKVWEEMPLSSSGNTVTVHILNLRRKLEDNPSSPRLIRTVWGKGYQVD